MGMFDSVNVKCPNCGRNLEFQSKSGDCTCSNYTIGAVPLAIATSLAATSEMCECGVEVMLYYGGIAKYVPMRVGIKLPREQLDALDF